MKARLLPLLIAFAFTARAGTELGSLPDGAVSTSTAGPSDELIGFLLFDPADFAARVPAGLRFRTLEEKAAEWPRLTAYLVAHPERRGWAWSFYEVIGIHAASYDGVDANFDAGRGGMAVWYSEVVRSDDTDARPLGDQSLALGSWISDPALAIHMRSRGYPATPGRVAFAADDDRARADLDADGLTLHGECKLEGPPFVPRWGRERYSFETFWTPAGEGDTFEVVTWAGHRSRLCTGASWRASGPHPFARLFNDPAHGDPGFYPTEFAFGYQLRGALFQRHPDLYAQVDAKLAADPALAAALGKPGADMASMDWLVGDWTVVAEVQAGIRVRKPEQGTSRVTRGLGGTVLELRDTYPSGTQDLGFLTFSPATRTWSSVGIDSLGNAIVTRGRATATGLVLEGDVTIVGVDTHLRQTITREGDRAYLLKNEERAADGSWRLLDTYRYTATTAGGSGAAAKPRHP